MNYYNQLGVVGSYKGYDVEVINYKDFTSDVAMMERVYAVKNVPGRCKMQLVLNGRVVGEMDGYGDIRGCDPGHTYYIFYEEEKKKPVEKKKEVKVKVKIETPEVQDYSYYSKTVDDFFGNLKDWWRDLEREV